MKPDQLTPTQTPVNSRLKFDEVLAHVIIESKSENPPYTFSELRDVLKKYYSEKMTLQDVIFVLMELYHLAVNDRRLQISTSPEATSKMILAPLSMLISDAHYNNNPSSVSLNTTVSIQTFYDHIIRHIITTFRFSNKKDIPELQV